MFSIRMNKMPKIFLKKDGTKIQSEFFFTAIDDDQTKTGLHIAEQLYPKKSFFIFE